jgi:hypothetical protein
MVLLMVPVRLIVWGVLLRFFYRPTGGSAGLLRWTLGGTVLSAATDALILGVFDKVSALRIGWC